MDSNPFISICIPAYKQTDYLRRLLDSIAVQNFRDFEVIITDDSNDDSVERLTELYKDAFSIFYERNNPALGSPENWNAGIRKAKGQWIKMMHDDDWFVNENSLQKFAGAAIAQKEAAFIFSGFNEVDIQKNKAHAFVINDAFLHLLQKTPLTLFKQNFIGHPSTTLIKNDGVSLYDKSLKWVVDIEFYIRYLLQYPHLYTIKEPLINIGINEHQITKAVFRNPAVEIPEVLYLYHRLPTNSFKNIYVYDYYWRFIRNLSIRSEDDIKRYAPNVVIPAIIQNMIKAQSHWPLSLLKKGLLSKSLMFISYTRNYRYL